MLCGVERQREQRGGGVALLLAQLHFAQRRRARPSRAEDHQDRHVDVRRATRDSAAVANCLDTPASDPLCLADVQNWRGVHKRPGMH